MFATLINSSSYEFTFFSLPPLLVGLGIFLLGSITIVRERGSTVSRLFFLMTSAVALWLVAISLVYASTGAQIARSWVRFEHVGVSFIPATLFHLAVAAMNTYQRYRKWVWIGWLVSFLFAVLTATTDLFVGDLYHFSWGYYPRYDANNFAFLAFFTIMLWAALRQYWREYRTGVEGSTQHRRARAFLIAFGLGYLASIDYLPAYGIEIYPLGYIPILAFLLCVAYAIRRYQLLEITPAFAANEIIQTMSETVLVLDQESIVRLVNPAATRLFEKSVDDLLGRSVTMVLEGATLPSPRELEQRGGVIRTREAYYRAPSGKTLTLSISASTLRRAPHGVVATVCVIRDITERIEAEARVRHEAARSQALLRVASRLNAQLELDAVLQAVCEEATLALNVPFATVHLYDLRRKVFYLAASHGLPEEVKSRLQPIPSRHQHDGVRNAGSSTVIPNLQTYTESLNARVYKELDIYTTVSAQMYRDKELVGRLNIGVVGGERHFNEEELQLLQGLADQAAQATANARLYEQAQRRLSHVEALRAIDAAIMSSPTLKDTLHVVMKQIVSQLQVDAAAVLLLDPDAQKLNVAARDGFRTGELEMGLLLENTLAGRAAREQRIVSVADLQKEPHAGGRDSVLAREGFIAYYAVPLTAKQQVKGVLEIFHRSALDPDSEWLDFMKTLAGQAALAIDNATLFMETKRLLQQIRAHAEQVQQIMDTVPEGLLLLDERRRILQANPAAINYLRLLGHDVDEESLQSATLQKLREQPIETFLTPAPRGAPAHEIVVGTPQERTFEVLAQPMQPLAKGAGLVIVLRDVTIERQIAQRVQQQDRLAAVGQLAAGIAHDFNNIMMVISLYVEMVERGADLNVREQKRLETIRQQAIHATNLIQQMLDFSRRSVLARRPVDLQPFLESFLQLIRRALPESIDVDFVTEQGEYIVKADETRLQQVLMNLAVNARDAMPGGGALTISLHDLVVATHSASPVHEMEPGRWLVLSVSDTGSGISPDVRARLFEPFFTTKEPGQGTGLGLAQVYGIVRQHEGYILVHSEEGEGTTFEIYLPAVTLSAQEKSYVEETLPVVRGSETILLAEDDAAARKAIQHILESHGYYVLAAESGRQAIELFDQDPAAVDLVLSDMVMPEMGGVELYRALKERQPGVKMIVITGYPLEHEGQMLLEDGILSWLPKPISGARLTRQLRAALDEAPTRVP